MPTIKSSETDLVRGCLQYLSARGIFAWRQNQGGVRASYKGKERFLRFAGAKGISDIIGIMPKTGRFLAIECKIKPNRPTTDQLRFLRAVEQTGGLSAVVYSIDDLVEAVNGAGEPSGLVRFDNIPRLDLTGSVDAADFIAKLRGR